MTAPLRGLVAVLAVSAAAILAQSAAPAEPSVAPMPLISRGVPIFSSSELYPARNANDSDYSTYWRGSIPSWMALDLSRVPAQQRHRVVVAWFNDPITTPYDHAVAGDIAYNNLREYTIDANAAPGGQAAPRTGWVTLVHVTGNRFHSRQSIVDLTGYNWVRIDVTAGDGSAGNDDAALNLDVYDAHAGVTDDWIFYGDSITEDGMDHRPVAGTGNFSQLVAAGKAGYFPAFEDGGVGGLMSADGAEHIGEWLSVFPGTYVTLNYGSNDANSCVEAGPFYRNYVAMVRAVIAAGKIPVVPTFPWARTSGVRNCGPALVGQIGQLYKNFPRIVKGPDLWTFFRNNPNLISGDDLHPSANGYAAYRQQWADSMLANAYDVLIPLRPLRAVGISGRARVGRVLHVKAPIWNRTPGRVAYQWQLCGRRGCSSIRQSSASSLRVRRSYVGRSVRVVATATADGSVVRSVSRRVVVLR